MATFTRLMQLMTIFHSFEGDLCIVTYLSIIIVLIFMLILVGRELNYLSTGVDLYVGATNYIVPILRQCVV